MLILPDKRNCNPSDILILQALTIGESQPDKPMESWHRLHTACLLSARRERGRWTRQKKWLVKSVGEFSELLRNAVGFSRPTYLFSREMVKCLTAVGFWELLESGRFNLHQTHQSPRVKSSPTSDRSGKQSVESGVLMENGPVAAVVAWAAPGAKLIATDLRNYADIEPKQLGQFVSLPWPDHPAEDAPNRHWESCAVDQATIVYRAICEILEWWNDSGLGSFGLTTGACSLSAFRNYKNGVVIETPEDEEVRDFERAAYFGGRNECFWVGAKVGNRYSPHPHCRTAPDLFHGAPKGTLHLVDAASFYGHIHALHPVPVKLIGVGEGMAINVANELFERECSIATVQLSTKAEQFPVRHNERVVYATGQFTTTLAGSELAAAASGKFITGVGRFHHYVCQPAISGISQKLWDSRCECIRANHHVSATFIKGTIAALHGKFSQRSLTWQVCPNEPCNEPWGNWQHYSHRDRRLRNYRAVGIQVQVQCDDGDARHAFPAIAAFTTASGRRTLGLWIRIAGKGNVLYCNTDSLIVSDAGLERLKWAGLMDDNALGGLRLKASSPDIEIRGQGCFSFADKLWMSGINRSRGELIFGTVHHQTQSGLAGVINNRGAAVIKMVTHELSPGWYYDPLRTNDDGWISPVVLNEGMQQWLEAKSQSEVLQE